MPSWILHNEWISYAEEEDDLEHWNKLKLIFPHLNKSDEDYQMMMNLDSEKNFEAFEANKLSNYLIAIC